MSWAHGIVELSESDIRAALNAARPALTRSFTRPATPAYTFSSDSDTGMYYGSQGVYLSIMGEGYPVYREVSYVNSPADLSE